MSLLSRREVVLWAIAFLLVSALLVATRFTSDDPDSDLYAAWSARLADGPAERWIAPEWWGHWDHEGLFREHPVGVLLLPTMLGALGVPGEQAAYVVGIASALASILLIAVLLQRVTSRDDARAALILLQLLPLAFIFRIRANHEYPMLVCLLVGLLGVDAVRRSWRGVWVIPLALCAGVLVKGAFVVVILIGLGAWILTNPSRERGPMLRPIVAVGLGIVAIVGMAFAYDAIYIRVAGESFWGGYWDRQFAPLTLGGTTGDEPTILHHLAFYTLRVLWHPAPWTITLIAVAWSRRRTWRTWWEGTPDAAKRGLLFGLGFAGATIALLLPSSRFAERYIFSANYALATVGLVVTLHAWPRLRAVVARWDARSPCLPVWCWTALMLLRLVLGPFLPRISG